MSTIVIYHKNCSDGTCSAWVAWKYFSQEKPNENTQYYPMNYGDDTPKISEEDNIYFIDFSLKMRELQMMAARCNKITVIDHHKTAQKELKNIHIPNNVEVNFDMDESGASLAWKHFFPNLEAPMLVRYIKDRDLWLFKEPQSDIIGAFIQSYPMTIDNYEMLYNLMLHGDGLAIARSGGEAILRYKETMINAICNNAVLDKSGIPTVNTSLLFSEVGHELCKRFPNAPYAQCYFDRLKDNVRQYSARSIGDFDVSEIAMSHGGGGHKNAAGWQISISAI